MSCRKRNDVIREFIEIYESEPCLWRIKSKEYRDRAKRDVAYAKLVQKLKELEPDADKGTVVKKINNLRSNLRKEKKKYKASVKPGASPDYIYKPTLWYYDLFDFLDNDAPGTSNLNIDEEESDNEENSADNQESLNEGEGSSKNTYNLLTDSKNQGLHQNADQRLKTSNENQNIAYQLHYSKPFKNNNDHLNTDLLPSARDLKRPAAQEDLYDLFGKTIAIKLRGLENRQRLIAEKIINDVLFEAEMGSLTTHSCNSHVCMQQYQATYPRLSPSPTFISSRSQSPSSCSTPTHCYRNSAITISPHILHPATTKNSTSEVTAIPLPVQVELSISEETSKQLI